MNRILIPLSILLASLLYSWFWNSERRPHCDTGYCDHEKTDSVMAVAPVPADIPTDTVEMTKEEQEELLFEPLDVYFESGKQDIKHNAEIDNFLGTAKKYLAANQEKSLNLVGHTDTDGTDVTNDPLSVRRAEKVKQFLVTEGFTASQLNSSGEGERKPIADNATAEGKAKNRRVTIRLAE